MNNTHEFAVGLRDLADWIEAHPEHIGKYTKLTLNVPVDTREELAAAARALGGERKKALDSFYYGVDREFGPFVCLSFFTAREQVCRRVVTGVKEIPEQTIPAHTEEIVEWVCDEPLLAGAVAA